MNALVVIVPLHPDGAGQFRVVLPRSWWAAGLLIGDRVLLDGQGGETIAAYVELGPGDSPIVRFSTPPERGTRRLRVRLARSA